MSLTQEHAVSRTVEDERLAGAIYGTIVVSGVLIATAEVGQSGTVDARAGRGPTRP